MTPRTHRFAVLLGSVFVALTAALPAARADRYALLVGVREYDKNELTNLNYTEDDVTALAQVFQDAGYRRVVLMTQTRGAREARYLPLAANVRKELKGLLEDRTEDDAVVVAFAGHGVEPADSNTPYFCPMDAKLGDKSTLISLNDVYKQMEQSAAGSKVLLADCCRNDPQSEFSRSVSKVKLESVTRPQRQLPPGGVAALFGCSAGEKAFESPTLKHGVFFYYVVEGLKGKAALKDETTVTLDGLSAYVKKEVNDQVKEEFGADLQQKPELIGKLSGSVALLGTAGDHSTAKSREPLTLKGHEAGVWCAAYSPNSKLIASGSLDKTIKLWDAATGTERSTLTGQAGLVHGLAFSGDGKALAAASSTDNAVRLWSLDSEQPQWSVDLGATSVDVAFNPTRKQVAASSTKDVWVIGADNGDPLYGKPLWRSRVDTGMGLAFNAKGDELACAEHSGSVAVFDAHDGKMRRRLSMPDKPWCVAYQPDRPVLAVGLDDGTVHLMDMVMGKEARMVKAHEGGNVTALAFSPDGKWLVTGSSDKIIKIFDATSLALKTTLEGHTSTVRSVSFSPDGKHIVSASLDKTVKIWDVDLKK